MIASTILCLCHPFLTHTSPSLCPRIDQAERGVTVPGEEDGGKTIGRILAGYDVIIVPMGKEYHREHSEVDKKVMLIVQKKMIAHYHRF